MPFYFGNNFLEQIFYLEFATFTDHTGRGNATPLILKITGLLSRLNFGLSDIRYSLMKEYRLINGPTTVFGIILNSLPVSAPDSAMVSELVSSPVCFDHVSANLFSPVSSQWLPVKLRIRVTSCIIFSTPIKFPSSSSTAL
jgi:hypothetical protein